MQRGALLGAPVAAVVVAGCVNPGIVQLSPDTYMLPRTDKGGIFGNASAMKASVIQDANQFAASKGKVAIPLESRETRSLSDGVSRRLSKEEQTKQKCFRSRPLAAEAAAIGLEREV